MAADNKNRSAVEGTDPDGVADFADFTELDGVGGKTAEALRSAGFTTMNQLAKASVNELVARLEEVGSSVPASRIISQRWLFQAWEHGHETLDQSVETTSETTTEQPDISNSDELPEADDQPWVEHATFIVCFDRRGNEASQQWQTRVWDTTAMAEEVVTGTDPSEWLELITGRADVPF